MKLLLLMALMAVVPTYAQDAEEPASPELPDPESLQSGWWSYFEDLGDEEYDSRVTAFFADIESRIGSLGSSSQEIALPLVASIRDNLDSYRELRAETTEEAERLPPPDESYTIARLLEIAADSRDADRVAEDHENEVEREQRILQGVRDRRDRSFQRYRGSPAGDEKLIAALQLIQNRSTLAITARRVALLTERSRQANEYAAALAERVELASSRLPTTISDEQMAVFEKNAADAEAAIAKAAERLQAAEIAASRLAVDTVEGRSQQRLERQRLIEAQVVHALSRLRSMNANTLRIWAALVLDAAPDTADLQQLSLGATQYIRSVRDELPQWRQESVDELLVAETTSREGLNRAARRLLDQRIGTAQVTLTRVDEVQVAADELELLIRIAENAYVDNVGTLQSWLVISGRFFKGTWQQIGELGDTTLFSIGETPVAGSDILRALIILIIAFILSRLVRHAIARIDRGDDAGTQASLYTVGRLSHYTIITIGVIVALSWIGLDFGNVAIIAGALGVGIGFGLQSIVGNFVSGLIILFEHSLRVGDYIELDTGLTGTVKAINVRSTLINTNDNIDIVVPNSEFVSTRLTNWTLGERILRMRIPFGVAYGSDKELVRKAALEAAADVHYTLKNMKGREPDVWLVEYGDNSLNFLLLVWVNRQGARRPTRTRAAYLWVLEDKFREYGIEIPFPQRDIHVRSDFRHQPAEPLPPLDTEKETGPA